MTAAPFLLAGLCTCPDCTRAARRFPDDPPQLAIPVPIYPSKEPHVQLGSSQKDLTA